MKPLGRQHYKDKTGGKHHIKINGKYHVWWTDICQPSKKRDRFSAKQSIKDEADNWEEYYE